mmetsp:Transcript_22160/g.37099  ORF Transcript_22160/g.37099 Transcript_22160/m.37099 type:complete len:87 (-) Transcript_22160:1845-2105(-)
MLEFNRFLFSFCSKNEVLCCSLLLGAVNEAKIWRLPGIGVLDSRCPNSGSGSGINSGRSCRLVGGTSSTRSMLALARSSLSGGGAE